MVDVTEKNYNQINDNVGWTNLPKAIVLALFGIIDVLTEIRDELRKGNNGSHN